MAQLFANNAVTTLAADLAAAAVSLTVAAGAGAKFPAPANGDYFLATLYTTDASGNVTADEIVQVTARAGDVFTIVRAQEGTAAQAWSAATAKLMLSLTAAGVGAIARVQRGHMTNRGLYFLPGMQIISASTYGGWGANNLFYFPIIVDTPMHFDQMAIDVTTAAAAGATVQLGICKSDVNWNVGALLLDAGAVLVDSTGVKTVAIDITLQPGLYYLLMNTGSAVPTLQYYGGSGDIAGTNNTMGVNMFAFQRVARNLAAFADPLPEPNNSATAPTHLWLPVLVHADSVG